MIPKRTLPKFPDPPEEGKFHIFLPPSRSGSIEHEFTPIPLYVASAVCEYPQDLLKTYRMSRKYFYSELEKEEQQKRYEKEVQDMTDSLASASWKGKQELFSLRKEWKSAFHKQLGLRPLCQNGYCCHEKVLGSEFCINHIFMDKNQKLFTQCTCGVCVIRGTSCPMCGETTQ